MPFQSRSRQSVKPKFILMLSMKSQIYTDKAYLRPILAYYPRVERSRGVHSCRCPRVPAAGAGVVDPLSQIVSLHCGVATQRATHHENIIMNTNLDNTCYELVCVCVQDAKASIAPMYEHELEQHSLRIGVCVQDAKASIAPITRRK
jgi:hypothetical protein